MTWPSVLTTGVVIEWTLPLVWIPVNIKDGNLLSLLWLSALTEVGSPVIIRVNNDVTLGLTKVTLLLTLIIIGLPTSVRALRHNRERRSLPFMFTNSNTTTTDGILTRQRRLWFSPWPPCSLRTEGPGEYFWLRSPLQVFLIIIHILRSSVKICAAWKYVIMLLNVSLLMFKFLCRHITLALLLTLFNNKIELFLYTFCFEHLYISNVGNPVPFIYMYQKTFDTD